MRLDLSIRQTMQINCRVCGKPIGTKEHDDEKREIALFGALKWCQCIGCGGAVLKPTKAYKRRYLKRLGELLDEETPCE